MLLLLAWSLACNESSPALFAASPSLEYSVKAAFLLNFTKFVDWPPSAFNAADAPLTICILGDDPFGRAIDQIVEGEFVKTHKVTVERVGFDQLKSCHVLYISDNKTMPAALNAVRPEALSVGEGNDFIHSGGMIAFVIDDRHVRFDINLKTASKAGLKLSSKLLSVARTVER